MARQTESRIRIVPPRPTVQIHLNGGKVLEGARNTQLSQILGGGNPPTAAVVGAIVNGERRELTYPIEIDSRVRPVTLGEPDGMRIYRRSLTFLLAAAFEGLFPGAKLTVDHSVASGGYFCQVQGRPALTSEELDRLEGWMQELVAADLSFAKDQVPLEQAIEDFRQRGDIDKVRLLRKRRKARLRL